jgi:general secretion pathway protein G
METVMKVEMMRRIRRLRKARGVTLIEILIVLAIVGLIAGGIAVYAIPKFQQAQKETTRQSAMALHTVSEAWRANHGNECPTPQLLKDQKEIAATSKITDAWDQPFTIVCEDDGTKVTSSGPDKKAGTADDITIPEPTKETP